MAKNCKIVFKGKAYSSEKEYIKAFEDAQLFEWTPEELGSLISYTEAKEIASSFLPDFSDSELEFVTSSVMKSINGDEKQLGLYKKGVVHLLNNSDNTVYENVLKHELFHKIYNEYLTAKERSSVFVAFKEELGTEDIGDFEELLAYRFQMRDKQPVKSSLIKRIFNKILRLLGLLQANTNSIEEFFKQIEKGQLTSIKQTVDFEVIGTKNLTKIQEKFSNLENFIILQKKFMRDIKQYQETGVEEITTSYLVPKAYAPYLIDNKGVLLSERKEPFVFGRYTENALKTLLGKEGFKQYIDLITTQQPHQKDIQFKKEDRINYVVLNKAEIASIIAARENKIIISAEESIKELNNYKKQLTNLINEKKVLLKKEITPENLKELAELEKKISFETKHTKRLEQVYDLRVKQRMMAIMYKNTYDYLYNLNYPDYSRRKKLESNTDVIDYESMFDELSTLMDNEGNAISTQEEQTMVDSNTEEATNRGGFAFDEDKYDSHKSIAAEVKDSLSTIDHPLKPGDYIDYAHAYKITLKLLVNLDPQHEKFFKHIEERIVSGVDVENNAVTNAVYNTIKNIYKLMVEDSYDYNKKGIADIRRLNKNAKFININSENESFIFSPTGVDLSKVASLAGVNMLQKRGAHIEVIQLKKGEITKDFTLRIANTIDYVQRQLNIPNKKDTHYINPQFDLINLYKKKAYANIKYNQLIQNINSQQENLKLAGETNSAFGVKDFKYRANKKKTELAFKSSVEQALILTLKDRNGTLDFIKKFEAEFLAAYKNDNDRSVQLKVIKSIFDHLKLNEYNYKSLNSYPELSAISQDLFFYFFNGEKSYVLTAFEKVERKSKKEEDKRTDDEVESDRDTKTVGQTRNYTGIEPIERVIDANSAGGVIHSMVNFLKYNNAFDKPTLTKRVDGKKVYDYTPSSNAKDIYERLTVRGMELINANDLKNVSGYENLQSSFLQNNWFNPLFNNDGRLKPIYKVFEHDGIINKSAFGDAVSIETYTKEKNTTFNKRVMSMGFFTYATRNKSKNGKKQYIQFGPIISNRPKTIGLEVDVLNQKDINIGLMNYVNQFINRPDLEIQGYNKYSTINFEIFDRAVRSLAFEDKYKNLVKTNVKKDGEITTYISLDDFTKTKKDTKEISNELMNDLIQEMRKELSNETRQYVIDLINQNVEFPYEEYDYDHYDTLDGEIVEGKIQKRKSAVSLIAKFVKENHDKNYFDTKQINALGYDNVFAYGQALEKLFGSGLYESWSDVEVRYKEALKLQNPEAYEKLGGKKLDSAFLKKQGFRRQYSLDKTSVKLITPAMESFVFNDYINSFFLDQLVMGDAAFFKDSGDMTKRRQGAFAPGLKGYIDEEGYGMEKTFKVAVFKDVVMRPKDYEKQLKAAFNLNEEESKYINYKEFKPADGQGYMLPERREEIIRGFGNAYGVGNVMKPAHYEIDQYGIPRMMKYSSIVLTDELVKDFPELATLRDQMRNVEGGPIMEAVFHSAFKVGSPKNKSTFEKNEEGKHIAIINKDSIVTLNNSRYKLQLNPEHALDDSVANPSQLTYFFKILGQNNKEALRVYENLANIMNIKLDRVNNTMFVPGTDRFNSEEFIKMMIEKAEGSATDNIGSILSDLAYFGSEGNLKFNRSRNPMSWNYPAIADKVFTQFASYLESNVIQTRYKGTKLVLMSQLGANMNEAIEEEKLRKELSFIEAGPDKSAVAEIYLPKGVLDKDQEDAIAREEELFYLPDALGFRIPSSEMHSAIAFKVVGFHSLDSNVIIAPQVLVELHGSDFDVDALYFIKREKFIKSDSGKNIKAPEKKGIEKETFLDIFKRNYNSDLEYIGYSLDNSGKYNFVHEAGEIEIKKAIEKTRAYVNEVYAENSDFIKNVDKNLEDILIGFYKNSTVNTILDVITSKRNNIRMASSIEMTPISKSLARLIDVNPFVNSKTNIDESSIRDKQRVHSSSMNGRDGTGIFANTIKFFSYAQSFTSSSVPIKPNFIASSLEESLNREAVSPTYFIKFHNDVKLTGIEDQLSLWQSLDSLLNAAIDNVKEQLLGQLNLNATTIPIYSTMLGLGLDFHKANEIMVQPVMRYISQMSGKEDGNLKGITLANFLLQSKIAMADSKKVEFYKSIYTTDEFLTQNRIEKGIKALKSSTASLAELDFKTEEDVEVLFIQLAILDQIKQVSVIAEQMTQAIRYLSIVKTLPVFPNNLEELMFIRQSIFNEENITTNSFVFDIDHFFESNPHIKVADDVLQKMQKALEKNWFKYNPVLKKAIENLNVKLMLDKNDFANNKLIYDEFMSFMYSSIINFDEIPPFVYKDRNDYTSSEYVYYNHDAFNNHFQNKVYLLTNMFLHGKEKEFLKDIISTDNYFLSKFFFKNSYYNNTVNLNFYNETKSTDPEKAKFEAAFNELRNVNIKSIHWTDVEQVREEIKNDSNKKLVKFNDNHYLVEKNIYSPSSPQTRISDLQREFNTYAIINYGAKASNYSFSQYLPSSVYREPYYALENQLKDLFENEDLSALKLNKIIDLFEINLYLNFTNKLRDYKGTKIWKSDENYLKYPDDVAVKQALPYKHNIIDFTFYTMNDNPQPGYVSVVRQEESKTFYYLYKKIYEEKLGEKNITYYKLVGEKRKKPLYLSYNLIETPLQSLDIGYNSNVSYASIGVVALQTKDLIEEDTVVSNTKLTINVNNHTKSLFENGNMVGKKVIVNRTRDNLRRKFFYGVVDSEEIKRDDKDNITEIVVNLSAANRIEIDDEIRGIPNIEKTNISNIFNLQDSLDQIAILNNLPKEKLPKTIKEAFNKNYDLVNPMQQKLMDLLRPYLEAMPDSDIVYDFKSKKGNVKGTYGVNSKEITIYVNRFKDNDSLRSMLNSTLLHEIIHKLTYNLIRADESQLTLKQVEAVKRLKGLYKLAQTSGLISGRRKDSTDVLIHYGMTDIYEFVAEAFTNQEFQTALDKIIVNKKSLWTRFLDAIRQLFNVTPGSLLEDVLNSTIELIEDGVTVEAYNKKFTKGRQTLAKEFDELREESNKYTSKDEKGEDRTFYTKEGSSLTYNRVTNPTNGFILRFNSFLTSAPDPDRDILKERFKNKTKNKTPDKDGKYYIDDLGKMMTEEEYVEEYTARQNISKNRGKAAQANVYYVITGNEEYLTEYKRLRKLLPTEETEKLDIYFEGKDSKGQPLIIKALKKKTDLNIFNPSIPKEKKDEVDIELTVGSDALGFAGTADLVYKRANGKFSMFDIKNSNLNYSPTENTAIMRFSEAIAGFSPLPNTSLYQAQMQVMTYALLFRLNNPDMQFDTLGIFHIDPFVKSLKAFDKYLDVDQNKMIVPVEQMLGMIEKMLKDKALSKKLGLLEPDSAYSLWEKLDQEYKSKGGSGIEDLFDKRHYEEYHSRLSNREKIRIYGEKYLTEEDKGARILEEIKLLSNTEFSDQKMLNSKESIKLPDDKVVESFENYRKKRLLELVIEYSLLTGSDYLSFSSAEDISTIRLWIDNSTGVENPAYIVWNNLKLERDRKAAKAIIEETNKFDNLLSKIKNQSKPLDFIDYEEQWNKYYTKKTIKETGNIQEVLISDEDVDLWKNLSKEEQKWLNHVHDKLASYFAKDSYFNKNGYYSFDPVTGTEIFKTHMQLYNERNEPFVYYKGWFPKFMITAEENRANNLKEGVVDGGIKLLKNHYRDTLTDFQDNIYQERDELVGIPIKYLGRSAINNPENKLYTKHIEKSYLEFVKQMEKKIALDDVYHLGRATVLTLQQDNSLYGSAQTFNTTKGVYEDKFKNITTFLNDRMTFELKGIQYQKSQLSKDIVIGNQKLNTDKVLLYGSQWATGVIMHLNAFGAAGNVTTNMMFKYKDALKNSIAAKIFEDTPEMRAVLDFQMKDLLKAEGEYATYVKDAMTGNIRKNKAFIIANEIEYLPDNYLFGSNQRNMRVERNSLFRYDNLYLLHTLGENYSAYTIMIAQLNHMKIEVNGKLESFWDLHEVMGYDDNNNIVPVEKATQPNYTYRWTGPKRLVKEGKEIKEYYGLTPREIKRMKAVSARMFGDYRKDEITKLNFHAASKIIVVLKNFFTRILINDFAMLTKSEDLGYYSEAIDQIKYQESNPDNLPIYEWRARVIEGKWITLGKLLASGLMITSRNESPIDYYNRLSPEQKVNVVDAFTTLAFFALAVFVGSMLFADSDDDDTAKKWWQTYMIDNASQAYNPVDMLRTISSFSTPVVFKKAYDTVDSFTKMLWATGQLVTGNEEDALTNQGDLQGWNTFKKSLSYMSWYFTATDKYEKWGLFQD